MANGHILNYAQGNPGAYRFLEELIHMDDSSKMNIIISTLNLLDSLR